MAHRDLTAHVVLRPRLTRLPTPMTPPLLSRAPQLALQQKLMHVDNLPSGPSLASKPTLVIGKPYVFNALAVVPPWTPQHLPHSLLSRNANNRPQPHVMRVDIASPRRPVHLVAKQPSTTLMPVALPLPRT